MTSVTRARLAGVALAACLAAGTALRADEGFWPFNAVPRAAIEKTYGFTVTDEWLRHVQLSSVRFGGASGSFVSPDGLVLTNHHVGLGAIQKLSTKERDLVAEGFHARTREEELKAADTELSVLQEITDVTARVNTAVAAGMSDTEAFAARRAAISAIEKEATSGDFRGEVVTLYQGGLYHLYRYKRYTDVRLVFAPEFDIAFFGGDPDNFTYPRYNLDITLFRVYENGQPAKVEHYLKWSPNGAKDGELVFTSGHPGATQRQNTVAHLEYLRDAGIPWSLKVLDRRRAVLAAYAARGPEQMRQVKDEIFSLENAIKSRRGQVQGLNDAATMARKKAEEQVLRDAVAADATMKAEFGDPWARIAAARKALPEYAREYEMLEGAGGFVTRLYSLARTIVRLAEEDAKPDGQRLTEFTQARRAALERQLFSPAPIYVEAEQAKLADSLAFLRETLGAEHPAVKTALAGKAPEARAAELVGGTALADPKARRALVDGGAAAIAESKDTMIQLARALDPASRAVRKRFEDEVTSVERDAYARIAQAIFKTHGTDAYPDATSTLRLSHGAVKGYVEDGKPIPPFTDFAGLYAHAERHGSKDPWKLPARWLERKTALDLATPFNFVSTNDIVGGNSGSPLVNRAGELVGVAFDGNIQSLPGYFIYDGSVNRTVSVDSRGIVEALRKVYEATALVDELLGRTVAAPSAAR